ncbi:hypothetical protein DMN91_012988 [Ooceraea biroi]|uniref:Nuclear pore complex protein Nup85 n=1 Tax=Ooceraea biroi TaxID=2015173 RepID=A0A3L8D4N6_OOCBI|nr:hypothetical protein DMN91_012988 [Ooceraea biroi]
MDEVSNAQIVVIGDDICRRAGITTTWINNNRFGIHAYKHIDKDSQDTQSQFAPCDAKVHFLRPEVILFSPLLRKLVNESNGVFLSVQNLKSLSGDIRPELLKHSKQYRSILRACVENLQEILPKEPLSEEKIVLENFLTIFYQVECVWHLTEILYVDIVPGARLDQLPLPSRELLAAKVLSQKTVGADLENSNYWEIVMGCAFHGKLNLVSRLLACTVRRTIRRCIHCVTLSGHAGVQCENCRGKRRGNVAVTAAGVAETPVGGATKCRGADQYGGRENVAGGKEGNFQKTGWDGRQVCAILSRFGDLSLLLSPGGTLPVAT